MLTKVTYDIMLNINCHIINIKLKGNIFHSFCDSREYFIVTMFFGNYTT